MIMFPLAVRIRLFRSSFRAKQQNLKDAPLLTPTDITLVPRVGWAKALWLLTCFRKYRQNLHNTLFTDLTGFYPRSTYMLYYYLLFWWANYCDVLEMLLCKPEGSLVPELFIRYIIEIDRLIDSSGKQHLFENPTTLKYHEPAKEILTTLLDQIEASDLPRKDKKRICRQIWIYRRDCLSTFKIRFPNLESDLISVVANKQITVGGLFYNWAKLLSEFYNADTPPELVDSSLEIIRQAGMAIQVLDDTLDWPSDFCASTDNIFHEYLKETPAELALAKNYYHDICDHYLDGIWMEHYLPITYKSTTNLLNSYLQKIEAVSLKPVATNELCRFLRSAQNHPAGV